MTAVATAPTASRAARAVAKALPEQMARAVIYLRVSTEEQASKGGRDEGFSIPAQRAANYNKAETIGAEVVAEFVDAGKSARRADRPQLKAMLDHIRENPVDYVIVHKVDRLARNRADDSLITLEIQRCGANLVSATESIDQTPSGRLMHGVMSSLAEYYSANLANEVLKGMTQKVKDGGTPSKAPVGYLNVHRRDSQGRDVRVIETDPDRAPLVTWMFDAYATGDWSIRQLVEEITLRGMRTAATPKRPAKPLTRNGVYTILTNRYYIGTVTFQGAQYEGKHPHLTDPATFEKVQQILTGRNQRGLRHKTHDHYLKGSLRCGSCGALLSISKAKNAHGAIYPYYVCRGRINDNGCTRSAIPIHVTEELVDGLYNGLQLTDQEAATVRERLADDLERIQADATDLKAAMTRQRTVLTDQRAKLLEAHYAGAIALDLLKSEQDRISTELAIIDNRLAISTHGIQTARANAEVLIDLLTDIRATYTTADDATKRMFNQALFDAIYIDEHDTARLQLSAPAHAVLTGTAPAIAVGSDTSGTVQEAHHPGHTKGPANGEASGQTSASTDRCLCKDSLVEASGLLDNNETNPGGNRGSCKASLVTSRGIEPRLQG